MAIITSYPVVQPEKGDYLIGSKIDNTGGQVNPTKNFTVESVVNVVFSGLPKYQDNAAALAGGLAVGQQYQTNGLGAAPLNVAGIVMIVQ
ncbi:hypothetical protein CMO95_02280 [Candidatus Woesearchaeota archaeon]|nr:hypothetical protein [Candidatus Woesearchaeota archaeon]|tara:strand:- start:2393 stop:2662 length:270 start_codon:yes stop_codon:yes gene_type:complete